MTSSSSGDGQPRPHVAFLAFPFGSHPAPLFAFARALAAAAPAASFSFFTSTASAASLPSPQPPLFNFHVHCIDDGAPHEGGAAVGIEERIGAFLRATPGNLIAALEEAGRGGAKVSCLVNDAFLSGMVADVAEDMGLPWVALWPGGPTGLLAHLYTDELRRAIGVGNEKAWEDEPLNCVPALSTLRVRDLPEGIVFGDINSGFSNLLHSMAKRLPQADAVAFHTFQGLDHTIDAEFTSKLKKYLPVGPLNLLSPLPLPAVEANKDINESLLWLDRQSPASVVYVSFSTAMMPSPADLAELAHGLESSNEPFLWSLKEQAKQWLPPGFLERTKGRGIVVPWAPQVQVLGHWAVSAFLNHAGWNSVMESVASGVPMVCRPYFGDQQSIARMLSQVWRIGLSLDGKAVTKEETAKALNVVLREEEGKMMRDRARELKEQAMRAVAVGGSSRENLNRVLEIVLRH